MLLAAVALALALIEPAVAAYNESLTMQPLENSKLFSQFRFHAAQPAVDPAFPQYTLFPRSLAQILEQTRTRELHLRFSQGWWDHELWGTEPQNGSAAGGIGVELWAYVDGYSEQEALDNWYTLVYSLSGFFCASLNFIDVQNTALPASDRFLIRGTLPGEPVCTENLTPFLKLLPCKGWSGIAALLDGHSLFDSQWQTMALDVEVTDTELVLNQSIASVFDVERLMDRRKNPIPSPKPKEELNCRPGHAGCLPQKSNIASWNLVDIFGKGIPGKCPVADSSMIHVLAPEWKVSSRGTELPHSFEVSELDLELQGPANSLWTPETPPISVERSFTGAGQQNGGVRIIFTNNQDTVQHLSYLEVIPWYMRVYLSTLSDPGKIIRDLDYKGAQIRGRPTQIEIQVELQPGKQASIEYAFDKSLLFIEEYPPDANHGFEISPGLVTTLNGYTTRTTSLLLSLPVPDFSMPYNVIILTSTVMTMPFSNILNMLIKVVIPEQVGEPYARGMLKKGIDSLKQVLTRWTKRPRS